MSIGLELEQDLVKDKSGAPLIYDPTPESRAAGFINSSFDRVDKSAVKDGRKGTRAQEPTVILSRDTRTSPFKPNQDFQQRTVIQYLKPSDECPTLNTKVPCEARCGTPKCSSSVRFHDASDVCSLARNETSEETEVSYFTKIPGLPDVPIRCDMHDQPTDPNKHTRTCVSLITPTTESEKGVPVLRQDLQLGSHKTPKKHEHVQSCKTVSSEKCVDRQSKSCTDDDTTLDEHVRVPRRHLKCDTVSAEASSACSSISDCTQSAVVHNLQKGNSVILDSVENFQTPLEISATCFESQNPSLPSKKEESSTNTPNANCTPRKTGLLTSAAHCSCEAVRKKENEGGNVLDDTPTCSQSCSSCELSLSDTNNTSTLRSNTDEETNNGQIMNIMNVGATSDVISGYFNFQEQSRSLDVSTKQETRVSIGVISLENTSKARMSEVDVKCPQTCPDFLDKEELAQVEPCEDCSTHFTEREGKIDPDCKSACVNRSRVSSSVLIKKRVRRDFKKGKPPKTARPFSTTQEPSENITEKYHALPKHHFRKYSVDFKRIETKGAKKRLASMHSGTLRCSAIAMRKGKKPLHNRHAERKDRTFCRKRRKVRPPALVPECGPNRCVKSSRISRRLIGQTFQASSSSRPNNVQKGSKQTNTLLGPLEEPVKLERGNEKHGIMSQSSAKDFHSVTQDTLLKTTESQSNDTNVTASGKQTPWNKRDEGDVPSTDLNGDADFELSLESTINSPGLASCISGAFYEKMMDEKELGELPEKDVAAEDALCRSNVILVKHSPGDRVDIFTQYYDEDSVTSLNKDINAIADANKNTKLAKKCLNCKYCRRSFRHISAYTVHQRIHTGEKPYRCEHCGKNFAQLLKLKSHRNTHVPSASWPCPCCRKTFSKKGKLMAHFLTHVKDSKRNNKAGQQGNNPDAPVSRSVICLVYNNQFTNGRMRKTPSHDRDKPTSCKTCGKEFRRSSQLAVHEKTHWPVKPYACSICGKSFNQVKTLKRHSQTHTGDTPFSCSQCGCAFAELPSLREHQISKRCNPNPSIKEESCSVEGFIVSHGVNGQVNTPMFFKCRVCRQLYRKWCQYTLHLQTHTKSPSYLCFACGQSYEQDSDVSVHCLVCCHTSGEEVACVSSLSEILHRDPRERTHLKTSSPNHQPSVEVSTGKSSSNFDQFNKNSQTLSDLQTEHLTPESSHFLKASHLPEPGNQPADDGLPRLHTPSVLTCASSSKSLECIEVSPSLWRFKCRRCGQRYKRYKNLWLHMQTHIHGFRHVCRHCGHSFKRWHKLWSHQRIHHRKGSCYTCTQCNLRFHVFSSYKTHLMNHVEERPYACPACPLTFADEEHLHDHDCTFHQTARKLQCDVCARGFSNLTNLVKHRRLHNGAVSHHCLPCNLSFANTKVLQERLNTHNNAASLLPSIPSEPLTFLHKCGKCKSSFSTGDLLYAHQICHTRDVKNRMRSAQSVESTSDSSGGTLSSNSRSLLSTLDLDAIPIESLFKYPHPDKLYVVPNRSKMSKSIPTVNLNLGDKDLPQESTIDPVSPNSTAGPSGQNKVKSSQRYRETAIMYQPQASAIQESVQCQNTDEISALNSDTVTDNLQDGASGDGSKQTAEFFETIVFLEGPTTSVNTTEIQAQNEVFECADCSEKLSSLTGLYEHYFLHALGNTRF